MSHRALVSRLRGTTSQLDQVASQWSQITHRNFRSYHHDLLRPLVRIQDKEKELRAILRNVGSIDEETTRELLDEIGSQGEASQLMMSNLQALIQIEGPRFTSTYEPFRLKDVVQGIIDRYHAIVRDVPKQISYYSDPDEFGLVHSDSAAIQHIVTDLVDNASKFAKRNIQIRLTRNDREFFISVWDDGPGISADEHPQVFERGWTHEASTGKVKSSAGLGLFISHSLAERAGGSLFIEKDITQSDGSSITFVLSLPVGQRIL